MSHARRRHVSDLARRSRTTGRFQRLHHRGRAKAWSCSMPCTAIQAEQATDLAVRWNCKAGKCGSCSAEINGKPKLMCMTRLNTLDLNEPVTVEPMQGVPAHQGSGHRRLVELTGQEDDQAVQAAQAGRARRHVADAAARRRPRPGIPQVHRVLPLPGRLPRPARSPPARRVHRPAISALHRRARDAPARHRRPRSATEGAHGIGYCNITRCCTKVCPEHITITENAIIPLKERVVDEFYDPLKKLLRVFQGVTR